MTRKPLLIAPLTVVLCAFALGDVAATIHSEVIAVDRAAAPAAAISLAQAPANCPPGLVWTGTGCACPPGTVAVGRRCVAAPAPPHKTEQMRPSLKPAQPAAPMKPRPLCTGGGKVLVGGNCVCPQGTVELSGRCVPRLTR